jgi:hypothetical protein
MITLTCKKLEGKHDALTISAPGVTQVIQAWKQPILPHELVHYVAEEIFDLRGFVRLVAAGHDPKALEGELMGSEALLAEALTNALQYDLAGQGADDAAYRALVEAFCENDKQASPFCLTPSSSPRERASAT